MQPFVKKPFGVHSLEITSAEPEPGVFLNPPVKIEKGAGRNVLTTLLSKLNADDRLDNITQVTQVTVGCIGCSMCGARIEHPADFRMKWIGFLVCYAIHVSDFLCKICTSSRRLGKSDAIPSSGFRHSYDVV